MVPNPSVGYSLFLYVLYVLLPLVPAILIFRLFPDAKVTLSGPLQNLTINATGAFAAYVITGLLGFFLVNKVETQIEWMRSYPIEGVIVDLGPTDGIDSDRFYSRSSSNTSQGNVPVHELHFVVLFNRPVVKTETIDLDYWEIDGGSGVGAKPAPREHPSIELLPTSFPQRFRVEREDGRIRVVNITVSTKSDVDRKVEIAQKGDK
jgi:hypothetical protein